MAQPNNRQNGGDRPPNGTQDPNFNWRGLVLFAIAVMLIGGAVHMMNRGRRTQQSTDVLSPTSAPLETRASSSGRIN